MDGTPLNTTSGVRCPSNFVDFKAKRQENYSSGWALGNFILLVTKFHLSNLIVVRLYALKGDVDILTPRKVGSMEGDTTDAVLSSSMQTHLNYVFSC